MGLFTAGLFAVMVVAGSRGSVEAEGWEKQLARNSMYHGHVHACKTVLNEKSKK